MRIRYNASAGQYRFRYYDSDSGKEVQLYKLNSPLESSGLSYGTLAVAKRSSDSNFTNLLTNPNSLSVTYSSSDTDVATINSTTGEVTIVGAGSTTITAASAETAVYKEGVATYVLTVTAWSAVTFGTPSNGSITVKKGLTTLTSGDLVQAGETITVTTTPDDGYELSTLVYNDGSNQDIKSTKSFTMPSTAVSIMATFTASGGGGGGSSYTITFSTGVVDGDGSTANTSTACSSIVSAGSSYLSGNLVTATKVYYGGDYGLKLGTSSAAGVVKMNLASSVTPTSIVVRAKLYRSDKAATISLNGEDAQSLTGSFANYTFNITSSTSYLQLNASKYLWVESITVNY